MPELPEVECVRRTLADGLIGREVVSVQVGPHRVVRGDASEADLLRGQRIGRIDRRGKQLALVAEANTPAAKPRCVVIHLGMSGQLRLVSHQHHNTPSDPGHQPVKRSSPHAGSPIAAIPPRPPHCHLVWRLCDGSELRFIDPRRFGGIWTFATTADRDQARWSVLGPDALAMTPARLHAALSRTTRPIKAALLDQHIVAGLGNIYVDELLFACGIHPRMVATAVDQSESGALCRRARSLLNRAIEAGGSTLRDYTDAQGQAGGFQLRHRVYGRAGLRCTRRACRSVLVSEVVAGRTTVWCPRCQACPSGDLVGS